MSTGLDLDTSILEALDFKLTPPCEHPQHHIWHNVAEPAAMWIRRLDCPNCGSNSEPRVIALCESAWVIAGRPGILLNCGSCGHPDIRDVFWRYLGPINA